MLLMCIEWIFFTSLDLVMSKICYWNVICEHGQSLSQWMCSPLVEIRPPETHGMQLCILPRMIVVERTGFLVSCSGFLQPILPLVVQRWHHGSYQGKHWEMGLTSWCAKPWGQGGPCTPDALTLGCSAQKCSVAEMSCFTEVTHLWPNPMDRYELKAQFTWFK